MQANKFLGFFIASVLVIFSFACEHKKNTSSSAQNKIFTDSISFWLEKSNAPNPLHYSKNLQKALTAVHLETNDSLKLNYSLTLSLIYMNRRDSINFWNSNKLGMSLAVKRNDSSKIADAHWDVAEFYENKDVIDSSYARYVQAQKTYEAVGDVYNSGRMLFKMAGNLSTIKDYTTAETYLIQAIELIKPLDKKEKNLRLYECYNSLGIVSNALKDFDKAQSYHEQALKYLDLLENKGMNLPRSQNNIGSVYLAKGEYNRALNEFSKSIAVDSIYFKRPELYAKALNNLGYSKLKMGDTTNVLKLFNKAIALKDSIQDKKSLSRSYFTMSEFLLFKNDTVGALQYANMAKKTARESDNNLRVLETLALLRSINPKNANAYFEEYQKLDDSLKIAERRSRNKFERIRFETDETLAENALLARQKQLWTGIAATLLLLAIATYIIIDQRRKNEKLRFQEEQQASNQRIFDLLLAEKSKIEEGKQLAQKRISEELHDAVQSRLQGIRMLLLGLNKRNNPEAIEERAEAIKELKNVQEEVRAISHEISHAAYQKIYSFISTIQELLNEVQKNAGLQSKFNFDEAYHWDNLDSDIKINVYRIIQESIQNCVKYAEASLVTLHFEFTKDEMLKVSIADNGKGFETKNTKNGIGMRNINSRIKKLGGNWEIKSEVGNGTEVILYIPTPKPKNPSATAEMKIA